MKFAIWGCRHGHIEDFIREMLAEGHTFLGICETEGMLADTLAKKYGVALWDTLEELWAQKPDIVGSSAVNNQKADIIEECFRRGIHVMVDKPLVTSWEQYKRVLSVLHQNGAPQLGMMLTERFSPSVYTLKQLIDRGTLGEIIGFTILKPHKLTPAQREPWHFIKEQNGGPVIDLMVHDFDLMRWMTGSEFADVRGIVKVGDTEGYPEFEDDARFLVQMKNGVTASLQVDWWTPAAYWTYGEGSIICTGTKGRCQVHTTGSQILNRKEGFCVLTQAGSPEQILQNETPPCNLTQDFLRRIQGMPAILTLQDILEATEISLLADRQAERIQKRKG